MLWFSLMALTLKAGSVINTRLARLAMGDLSQTHLMVTEKVGAAFDACSILASGGDAAKVVACYRRRSRRISIA